MKNPAILFLLLVHPLMGEPAQPKPAFRDAATNETLTAKFREVSKKDPMAKFEKTKGEDPSVKNKVGSLLARSELITFNGNTTLVPKNAIIRIPEKYKSRVNNHKPGSKILNWADFYRLNRGWINTIEVSFSQAKGLVTVSGKEMDVLDESGNLVVAVLKNSPVSVNPLKENTETTEKEKLETTKPGAIKPEATKPGATKPETTKPEGTKTEGIKP
jgi:hypothetical protein